MREILFRGIDEKTKGFVEGNLSVSYDGKECVIESYWQSGKCITMIPSFVDKDTIGQYTGMKDKNGVKIFEGDIVRRHEEPFGLTDVGVVVYNEAIGSFRLHVEKNGTTTRYDFVASDTYNDGYCHVECKATFEVIGNKFDNPELLEGGKQ